MERLVGKVALVSGAARGQGEAEARLFVAEGAQVVLGDVIDESGVKVAADLGESASYVHLDVTSERDWASAVRHAKSRFGGLDILVNNAGIARNSPIVDCSLDAYMEVVAVNQVGAFLGMRFVIPLLAARGGGSIINISSTSGLVGVPGTVAYTASKFAVRGMTKTAALELASMGIRVNSVHPGVVDTDMLKPAYWGGAVSGVEEFLAGVPMDRLGQPIELARLVLFLASDDSSYCTGSEFVADGGYSVGAV